MAIRVDFIGIGHFPCSARAAVVIGHCFHWGGVFLLIGIEGVAIFVLGATHLTGPLPGIDLEYGVIRAIDIGVYTQAEEMLMVMCVDAGVNFCSPSFGIFAWIHSIRV